jgi:hypothetical protein
MHRTCNNAVSASLYLVLYHSIGSSAILSTSFTPMVLSLMLETDMVPTTILAPAARLGSGLEAAYEPQIQYLRVPIYVPRF